MFLVVKKLLNAKKHVIPIRYIYTLIKEDGLLFFFIFNLIKNRFDMGLFNHKKAYSKRNTQVKAGFIVIVCVIIVFIYIFSK